MDTTPSATAVPDGKDASAYSYWHDDTVRFNDIDPMWHLTSTAYLVMMENARIRFIREAAEALDRPHAGWMLVKANINYMSQVHYPDPVRIGIRVQRIGRSSVSILHAMFNADACAAVLEGTLVLVDGNRDRAVPIPEDLRTSLQALSDGVPL